jgi:WD40 repeat protein
VDLKVGTGKEAKAEDTVIVHYTGMLKNGKKFDSSFDRNAPFSFQLGKGTFIKGFEDGVAGMKEGGKRRLVIPPKLGYGARGLPNKVPPDAELQYELELIRVTPNSEKDHPREKKDILKVKDDGQLFGAEVIKKANEMIREIAAKFKKDLVIETFVRVPGDADELDRAKKMSKQERLAYFHKWAQKRVEATRVNGIYVLVCKNPVYIKIEVTKNARSAFDSKAVSKLERAILEEFRGQRFDKGLLAGVKVVGDIFAAAKKNTPIFTLSGHDAAIKCVAFAPNGKIGVSADVGSAVRVWDLEKGEEIRSHALPEKRVIQDIVFLEKESVFSVVAYPSKNANPRKWTIKRWDASSGRGLGGLESLETNPACHSRTIVVSPRGNAVILTFHPPQAGIQFCNLQNINLAEYKEANQTAFEAKVDVAIFAISPDGRRGVSASGKKRDTLVLWDIKNSSFQAFRGSVAKVECLAFSGDGKSVLSGSADKTFSLWNVATKKLFKRFRGHSGVVHCVAFSPDGKRAVTGSSDKSVRLWNLKSGKELRRFTGHKGSVNSVAFSPGGQLALSGGSDKTVKLWRLPK